MNNMFLPQTNIVRWMDMTDFPNEKWKDAVEAALKYCLENLI